MDSKNNVVELVNKAKKPTKGGNSGNGGGSGGGHKERQQRFADYAIINNAFHQIKSTRSGDDFIEVEICLGDFTAEILEEITNDDGLEDKAVLRIAAKRNDGMQLPVVDVPSSKFYSSSSNWINDAFGSRLFVYPGATKRDHLRACIQRYSQLNGDIPRRHVYCYTGWKKINDQWHYLTGTGSITADGLQEGLEVDLGAGHMTKYRLPPPLSQSAIVAAMPLIRDLLNICPSKPYIGACLLATVARALLGECHPIDYCLFLHGLTGTRKSSITALAIAFFGEFSGNTFPANWSDTENDMEAKAFQAKDSLFVIDDFKPSVNVSEAARLHTKAERFIRNTGNHAGRGRRNNDMSSRAAPYNRSMSIITGEDLPKGQSLLGRLLILELLRHDVDLARLTRLQDASREQQLAGIMAAYLQWLAPKLDSLKSTLPQLLTSYRDDAIKDGFASSHPRAPEIYASKVGALEIFLEFLTDAGALTVDQNTDLLDDLKGQIRLVFSEQGAYQNEQDECQRFLNLLRSLFSSGNAHIAQSENKGPPETRPHAWGWVNVEITGIEAIHTLSSKPMGDCIGWHNEKYREVWLDQDSAFAAVQKLAKIQGDAFLLSAATLWRRMGDRGLIVKFETRANGTKQWTVKRTIDGVSKRVMILSADIVEGAD